MGTYQTNKRNHFKEIKDRVYGNIEIEITKFVFALKKTYWPHMEPLLLGNVILPSPHFGLSQGTNKINTQYHFKEIGGWVFGNYD